MRIQADTDLHQHNFELLEEVSLTIPNHFSAIDQISQIRVQTPTSRFYQMLDQLIIEFTFDLQVNYIGVNHLTYTLTKPIVSLQKVEQPRGKTIEIFTENIQLRQDYHLKWPDPKPPQLRQFQLVLFLHMEYFLGANREKSNPSESAPQSQLRGTASSPSSGISHKKWRQNGINWYK